MCPVKRNDGQKPSAEKHVMENRAFTMNPYVRTRIRLADTYAFAASDFYIFVYPYIRLRLDVPV